MTKRSLSKSFIRSFALVVFLMAGLAFKINAQTVIYVDAAATGLNNGTSWANAYNYLSTAITLANSNIATSNYEIRVAQGTYYPTGAQSGTNRDVTFSIARGGVKLYGGYPTGGGARNITANVTTLSGDIGIANNTADNSYHVITIVGISSTADSIVVNGFTIAKGNANVNSQTAINGVLVARKNGAGIYTAWNGNNQKMLFSDLILTGGNATNDGGGINCRGGTAGWVKNCTFTGNTALYGGGLANNDTSATLVTDCTFTGNSASSFGGGMYNLNFAAPTIANCTFISNSAGSGAGMYNSVSAAPVVSGCIFLGGTAGMGGGLCDNISSTTITNCIFSTNTATNGGGIYSTAAATVLTNCTIYGNTASSGGGGIYSSSSSVTAKNCILYGDGTEVSYTGTAPAITYSTVQGGYAGTGNLSANPLFVNASSPAGTDGLYRTTDDGLRLQCGSPAGGAGTSGSNVPATDIINVVRNMSTPAMGAYEQGSILLLNTTLTNVSCFGDATGRINASASGGTLPYQYALNAAPYSTGNVFNGLTAGTYVVAVKDAVGCIKQVTVTITQPAMLGLTTTHTNVLCYGAATGSITATGTGGVMPYTYALGAGGAYTASNVFNGLAAGTYQVFIKDANGCITQSSVMITQPATPLSVNTTQINVLCNGDATGSINANANGGTAPYQYALGSGAYGIGNVFSGLAAGVYTVFAKDAAGCVQQTSVTITQPAVLALTTTHTNVLCYGAATGSITATGTGGVTPYTYALGAGGAYAASNVFNGLAAGTYQVFIKDANGCIKQSSVTITQPAASLSVTATHTNGLCNGDATGSINATANGGTAPYQYALGSGTYGISNVFSGLAAGVYTAFVRDAAGCIQQTSVTITQPAALALTTTHTNVLCYGAATGSITAMGAGGVTPYTYALGAGGAYTASNVFNGLAAGTYQVFIKDANGCIKQSSVTITQPAAPLSVTATHTNVLCNGDVTGSINATANGGTAPYQYALGSGVYGTSNIFSGLAAGVYTVSAKDAAGCVQQTNVTITQPAALGLATTHTNVSCHGAATASITATGTGGVTPYTYALGTGGAYTASNVFNGLAAGTYQVFIKDANGCAMQSSVMITQPATPLSSNITHTNVLCNGGTTGSINAAASGGVAPYQYALGSGYGASNVFSGLAAGGYIVSAKDAAGCVQQTNVTITQPATLVLNIVHINVLCFGTSTGSITATGTGGATPYTYSLGAGGVYTSTNVFNGLGVGTYQVSIKDANGCIRQSSVTLTQPATPLSVSAAQVNVLCNGAATGSIAVTATGGTAPYQYALGSGAAGSSATFTALAAGTYTIVVTDQNGCTGSKVLTITQPAALSTSAAITAPLCAGKLTGHISITTTGGTAPYTYLWSTAATTANLTNVAAGTYYLLTKDANQCSRNDTFQIVDPGALYVNLGPDRTLCKQQSAELNATIAVAGTQYTWVSDNGYSSSSSSVTISEPGKYTVTAITPNGCIITDTIVIRATTGVINADFAAATQGFKDSLYTLVNISDPKPDSITWILPPTPSCVIKSKQFGTAEVVFNDTGVYDIGIHTYLGGCDVIKMSRIVIVSGSAIAASGNYQQPFIKKFVIYPNPSTGSFSVDITLDSASTFSLKMINAKTGERVNTKTVFTPGEVTVPYNVSLPAGTYILLLETSYDSRTLKIEII